MAIKLDDLGDLNPRVSVAVGATLNMGNYQSARADVGLSVDLPDGYESLEEFMEDLRDAMFDKLDTTLDVAIARIQGR